MDESASIVGLRKTGKFRLETKIRPHWQTLVQIAEGPNRREQGPVIIAEHPCLTFQIVKSKINY